MNANTNTILSNFKGSDEDWIDEDDAPELTGAELYHPDGKFYVGGVEVNREVGMAAFGKKLREIETQKQTANVIHFKHRTAQNRMQLITMRQMMSKQAVAA